MMDENFDRTYQSGRKQLHAGIDAALERLRCGVLTTFATLNRIQFAAPWKKNSSNDVGCA